MKNRAGWAVEVRRDATRIPRIGTSGTVVGRHDFAAEGTKDLGFGWRGIESEVVLEKP